jgi:hypothetical protein
MAAIIRCIRDTVTNDAVYVNLDTVKYFDAITNSKRVTFHFSKGESVTVKETLEKVIEMMGSNGIKVD